MECGTKLLELGVWRFSGAWNLVLIFPVLAQRVLLSWELLKANGAIRYARWEKNQTALRRIFHFGSLGHARFGGPRRPVLHAPFSSSRFGASARANSLTSKRRARKSWTVGSVGDNRGAIGKS